MRNEPNSSIADCGLQIGDRPTVAHCAKRTQFPVGPGGTRPHGRGTRGNRAKRTQFPAGPGGPIVRNEANFASGGGAGGARGGPVGPVTPSFHYSLIPGFQFPAASRRVKRAKRTQFPAGTEWDEVPGAWDVGQMCKTKPICRWDRAGRDLRGAGRGAIVQNEPNFTTLDEAWGTKSERGKQSQSPADRLFYHSSPMPIVQNEPNSREPAAVWDRTIVQNEPNFVSRGGAWGRGANGQNKANFGGGVECQAGSRVMAVLVGGPWAVYNVGRA